MNRLSRAGTWICWALTLAACFTTLWFGFYLIIAQVFSGSKAPDEAWFLAALAPSALALAGNGWMLWGGTPRETGVSPWWLVPSFLIALGTAGFGAYVCLDILVLRSFR